MKEGVTDIILLEPGADGNSRHRKVGITLANLDDLVKQMVEAHREGTIRGVDLGVTFSDGSMGVIRAKDIWAKLSDFDKPKTP